LGLAPFEIEIEIEIGIESNRGSRKTELNRFPISISISISRRMPLSGCFQGRQPAITGMIIAALVCGIEMR
jgi:hypothetical protein